ncbi:S9 family peptidase [Proteinivorax hydrogeniformans]|uniref:S9 family peptidase n=1 Tax=Proteinivorax hydrogeniformans TaxID=1826727 RepID=A0AAU8HTZ0_9FIRM
MENKIKVEDFYRLKNVSGMDISPDEQKVVYVEQKVDKEKDKTTSNIFLVDLKAENITQLTFSGKDRSPVFSPDGSRIAFISSREKKSKIWILPLAGGEAWSVPTKQSVSGPLIWTPDGENIIYNADVFSNDRDNWTPYPGAPEYDRERLIKIADKPHSDKDDSDEKKENAVKVVTRFDYKRDGLGFYGDVRSQIFITPVPHKFDPDVKPEGEQITSGDFDHSSPTLSPCGKYIIVSGRRTENADLEQKSDLWLWDIEAKQPHLIYDAPGPTYSPSWSPCGNYLAFLGHNNIEGASTSTHLWIANINTFMDMLKKAQHPKPLTEKDVQNVTAKIDRTVRGPKGWRGDKLVFLMLDRGAGCVYEVEPKAQPRAILAARDRSIANLKVANDNIVYVYTTPVKPDEIYVYDGNEEKQISNLNTRYTEEVSLGKWEEFTYKSDDGENIDGWVIYPPEFDDSQKYPMVLLVHGGPHSAYGPSFMFLAQAIAAQGYVVLYTNPRGSETYGQQFACVIDKNWGDRDYADVLAGVDALVARGFIDTDKMFMHGWSYGGYMACWISTQTDRFKAICAGASVTNMLSGYGTSDITLADEYEYGGKPWSDYAHLIKHSPIGHVENVTTPVMLMHGENDLRVSVAQTEEFYIALKRLGKEAIMVRYPNEFHGPSRPIHRLDRLERLVSWFNYYRG